MIIYESYNKMINFTIKQPIYILYNMFLLIKDDSIGSQN